MKKIYKSLLAAAAIIPAAALTGCIEETFPTGSLISTDQIETVQIGDITADFYPSESEDSAPGLAWVDPENDYLICLDGFFSQEELIDMASSLVKTEIPKTE